MRFLYHDLCMSLSNQGQGRLAGQWWLPLPMTELKAVHQHNLQHSRRAQERFNRGLVADLDELKTQCAALKKAFNILVADETANLAPHAQTLRPHMSKIKTQTEHIMRVVDGFERTPEDPSKTVSREWPTKSQAAILHLPKLPIWYRFDHRVEPPGVYYNPDLKKKFGTPDPLKIRDTRIVVQCNVEDAAVTDRGVQELVEALDDTARK